jgi:hypothetical protein
VDDHAAHLRLALRERRQLAGRAVDRELRDAVLVDLLDS